MTSFPRLFSPVRLRNTEIRNRILSTGHQTYLAKGGLPGEDFVGAINGLLKNGTVGVEMAQEQGILQEQAKTFGPLGSEQETRLGIIDGPSGLLAFLDRREQRPIRPAIAGEGAAPLKVGARIFGCQANRLVALLPRAPMIVLRRQRLCRVGNANNALVARNRVGHVRDDGAASSLQRLRNELVTVEAIALDREEDGVGFDFAAVDDDRRDFDVGILKDFAVRHLGELAHRQRRHECLR